MLKKGPVSIMNIETLCINPFVAVIDDFFDADLARHIIAKGAPALERARVVNAKGGRMISDARTNSAVALTQWEDPQMTALTTRLSDIVRLPPENSEPCNLLHYVADQEFKPHNDGFHQDVGGIEQLAKGGQRLFTTICYLNDLETGGETEFPSLRIQVRPKLGRVLVFGNIRLGTTEPHPHSIHAGRPVGDAEKWALTHWWRQLAYHVQRDYPAEKGAMRKV